ncbi:helix-turn-helix domain-containing protein [Tenacibaculum sp. SZ-18]|uniref:helix-turn-helix domain-containing protein n=1 Tax=Tenacibaculum sp. SZ-18 TaxID=754423 RepID=UPI001E2BD373|nr:helix-turn-helix domain-containing protein [Tenacibaculum sp. SZ-18]
MGSEAPSAFIKNSVITGAKRQLLYILKEVKLIAFDLGFYDLTYFSYLFQKQQEVPLLNF